MGQRASSRSIAKGFVGLTLLLATLSGGRDVALADEGGVSFWLPGIYGSLAAVPAQPGWSLPVIYYHMTNGSPHRGIDSVR
jgi:hypothetical protein